MNPSKEEWYRPLQHVKDDVLNHKILQVSALKQRSIPILTLHQVFSQQPLWSFTFLDRAFFLLVMRSMSSKRMMNISMAFPVSTNDRDPSIRICLNERKFNFHPCYDRQTDPEADMTGIWRSYISNQPDVRSKTTTKNTCRHWHDAQRKSRGAGGRQWI